MAEDRNKTDSSKQTGLDSGDGETEPSMLLQKLKSNISKNVQSKVDAILQEVQRLSDNDKLFLYLQLPSGPSAGEKSNSSESNSVNTADQLHTCTWIRSHLEEHADTCLPKQDVYETYRKYCDNLQQRPLSAANFGKIIRDIFPNIKARRLGGRGQSKYCYSGIRRKTVLNMPLLPNLDLKNDPSELTELVQTYKQEVTEAACELICDWAQKILKRSFDTVVEIARFLVQEHIVNPRCSQAELVTSAALAGGPAKPHKVIKKNPAPPKGSGSESEGGRPDAKNDKDSSESLTVSRQQVSDKPAKGSDTVRPGGRDLQVEALMKKLPQLLPRVSVPEKTQLSIPSSPPSLAPKDTAGVKVTLPITMATLPSQQGGTLPVMILPSNMSLSYPEHEKTTSVTVATSAAPTPVVQRARVSATKRTAERPALGSTAMPPKKKRGRPRKQRPEEASAPPQSFSTPNASPASLTGGVIQKALPSSSATASPQVLEFVIQEPPLVLGAIPSMQEVIDGEQKGVVVQCQSITEPKAPPVVIVQSTGQGGYEMNRGMVIQRAPVSRPPNQPTEALSNPAISNLPPPTLLEDKEEVEITLTPVDPQVDHVLVSSGLTTLQDGSREDSPKL
ncbi:DNA-binding protein RFX5 [Chanos chanos]|uniref:DNA-binding protein RFX5 n=1 Tax=Chanos chanos TaxID=29144 RepID=A0A6J2UNA8_CHACN|nr:DNA-binding protein RFX5 [Chanos chanos]